jgi:hypothetical protein
MNTALDTKPEVTVTQSDQLYFDVGLTMTRIKARDPDRGWYTITHQPGTLTNAGLSEAMSRYNFAHRIAWGLPALRRVRLDTMGRVVPTPIADRV